MFVSGLFKITEPKIVHSIEQRCQSIPLSHMYGITEISAVYITPIACNLEQKC